MSGIERIYRPNPLAYPGRAPGFDPGHIAVKGAICRFSAVARNGNFHNLLNGKKGTLSGTPKRNVSGLIGESASFGNGNSDGITFSGQSVVNDTVLTLAGIFHVAADLGSYQCIFATGGSGGYYLYLLDTGTLGYYSGADQSSGLVPAANTPYFFAASINSTTKANFVLTNLATGTITTASITPSFNGGAPNGTYVIGNQNLASNSLDGSVAAVAYVAKAFLSPAQLLAWAADPWAFWYPRTQSNLMFAGLGVSASGTLISADSGGGIEWTASRKFDSAFYDEIQASLKIDNASAAEITSAQRRDEGTNIEGTLAVRSDAIAQGEIIAGLRSDQYLLLEAAAAYRADAIVDTESGLSVRTDANASDEAVINIRSDENVSEEWTGAMSVAGDSSVPLEWLRVQQAESAVALEGSLGVRADGSIAAGYLTNRRTDGVIGVEALLGVRGDGVVPAEWTGAIGVTADGALPTEWVARSQADANIALETVAAVRLDGKLATESLITISNDAQVAVENSTGILARAVALIENFVAAIIPQAIVRYLSNYGAMPPQGFGAALPPGPQAPFEASTDGSVDVGPAYRRLTQNGALESDG